MPPNSRGLLLLSAARRHASTKVPHKASSHPQTSNTATKPKTPPQPGSSRPNEAAGRSARPNPPSTTPTPAHPTWRTRINNFLFDHAYRLPRRIILSGPVLFMAFMHLPYTLNNVTGPSMAPFFNPDTDDKLAKTSVIVRTRLMEFVGGYTSKSGPNKRQELNTEFGRGQVVIYNAPHDPEKLSVKRIVAVAGDIVQPLPGYPGGDEPVVVPWNHVWVEGDIGRRDKSMDSNWFGPISENLIVGEVKAVWPSWFNIVWLGEGHVWPARAQSRVQEDAVMEATVNPDEVKYSDGWRDGSIALILERIRRQPDLSLEKFVTDAELRQQTRRLYNNALYVKEVATSGQEKRLATDLADQMEVLYGREALVFGIQMRKRRGRDRGELPTSTGVKKEDDTTKDQSASTAEKWLRQQGWEIERHTDGTVKTKTTLP